MSVCAADEKIIQIRMGHRKKEELISPVCKLRCLVKVVCIEYQSCDWRASELKGGNLFTTSELLILKCYVFDWILKVLWSQTFDMR